RKPAQIEQYHGFFPPIQQHGWGNVPHPHKKGHKTQKECYQDESQYPKGMLIFGYGCQCALLSMIGNRSKKPVSFKEVSPNPPRGIGADSGSFGNIPKGCPPTVPVTPTSR